MMNEQQLEYVRINLRAALLDSSGGTKGQLEAFAEHPPADKERNPRKPVHMVELDDGRGGTRSVKATNSALYVLETRSRRRPLPPIDEYDFSTCGWRRAVLKLDEYQQAWIKYCYGCDLDFKLQRLICQHIWENFQVHREGKALQKKVKERLITLVWLSAQDVAAKNKNNAYTESTLIYLMGSVAKSTWSEIYASRWQGLKSLAAELDHLSLMAVLRHREQMIDVDIAKPNEIGHI